MLCLAGLPWQLCSVWWWMGLPSPEGTMWLWCPRWLTRRRQWGLAGRELSWAVSQAPWFSPLRPLCAEEAPHNMVAGILQQNISTTRNCKLKISVRPGYRNYNYFRGFLLVKGNYRTSSDTRLSGIDHIVCVCACACVCMCLKAKKKKEVNYIETNYGCF